MKVAIFASGNGTNFEVLAKAFKAGKIPGKLVFLFCDHPNAKVVKRAKTLGVQVESFTLKSCANKQAYEEKILDLLHKYQIDFIALAGYMRMIEKTILNEYEGRITNIHPSFLPEYPGINAIERAFNDHVKETGVTIHYIDEHMDEGTILIQKRVSVNEADTLDQLEQRIHNCEHKLYPKVLQKILSKRNE